MKVEKSASQWQQELTSEQYRVLREKGTERAFTGEYWNHKGDGVYVCAGCGESVFDAETKYDSGSGWPSFYAPHGEESVAENRDLSHGMVRTEVVCASCGGHLGHVFPDGPRPTGQRYCINSTSLAFKEKE